MIDGFKKRVIIACANEPVTEVERRLYKKYRPDEILCFTLEEGMEIGEFFLDAWPMIDKIWRTNEILRSCGIGLTTDEERIVEKIENKMELTQEEQEIIKREIIGPRIDNMTFITDANIFDMDRMMEEINNILEKGKDNTEFLISIATGTPEYITAASILAMIKSVKIISVTSAERGYQSPENDKKADRNSVISPLEIQGPEMYDLKSLKVFDSIADPRDRTNTNVVRLLIQTGLWNLKKGVYEDNNGERRLEDTSMDPKGAFYKKHMYDRRPKILGSEATFYQRNMIDKWSEEGYISKMDSSDKYMTT